jgi:fluoride exporter
MVRFVMVCLGGALGTGARYLVATAAARLGSTFPIGTAIVNLAGSFLVSFVMVLALEKGSLAEGTRLFVTTGVLGGFTTYSSFNHETLRLAESGAVPLAAFYAGVTLLGCLGAGLLGLYLARSLA